MRMKEKTRSLITTGFSTMICLMRSSYLKPKFIPAVTVLNSAIV